MRPSDIHTDPPDYDFAGTSCTFGVFDGIHSGHRFIIQKAIDDARSRDGSSVIITFDEDPSDIFASDTPDKLMTNEERIDGLRELGSDGVVAIRFDEAFSALPPVDFLDELFYGGAPSAIFIGEDTRFGKNAEGDIRTLRAWAEEHGMEVFGVALLEQDGSPVTSTRIRKLLFDGEVEEAAKLLGHPYSLSGRVVTGREVGRRMGIRTANLEVPDDMLIPEDGVYATFAVVDGKRYKAASSIGVPITFEGATKRTIEAHLLDFEGDIYGKKMEILFIKRLRDMIKFNSTEELIAQIDEDIANTRLLETAKDQAYYH